MIIGALCIAALAFFPQSAVAESYMTGPGFVGTSFNLTEDGLISYTISGPRFDAYIMPTDQFLKYIHNESFGYVSELSRINTSSADVQGNLQPGNYTFVIYSYSSNRTDYEDITITYPSRPIIPLDFAAIVLATNAMTALVIYALARRRKLA